MSTSARRAPGRTPSRAIHPGEHQYRPRLAETEPRSTRWRPTGVPGLGPASSPTSSHQVAVALPPRSGAGPERGVVERAHPVVGVRQQHQSAARGTTHQAGVEHRAAAATRHGPTCSTRRTCPRTHHRAGPTGTRSGRVTTTRGRPRDVPSEVQALPAQHHPSLTRVRRRVLGQHPKLVVRREQPTTRPLRNLTLSVLAHPTNMTARTRDVAQDCHCRDSSPRPRSVIQHPTGASPHAERVLQQLRHRL